MDTATTHAPVAGPIPSFSLIDRKVFVTGGSRGIGRACALTLAAAGADVAVGSSPAGAEGAETVCREIRELGHRAKAYPFDIAERGDVETMCHRLTEDFGRIDVLVNNAGVTRDGLFRKMERTAWDAVINTNLSSVFEITQRLIEPMAARGWGRVINISSIVGRIGNFGQTNYAAAKAGLIGFTKALAPISIGSAKRPIGVTARTDSSAFSGTPSSMRVLTNPGAIALTVTPLRAYSRASALVKPMRPALAAA